MQSGIKILITRLSHIGDCILTLPMVCAIRDSWPDAQITWVVESPTDQLLTGHDSIDRLITVPRDFLKQPRAVFGLRQQLRELNCDVAIDPQSLTKSSIISWLAGVPRRIGFDRPWGRELAPWLNTELLRPQSTHVVDRSMDLLQALGMERPTVRFSLPSHPASDKAVDKFLTSSHLGGNFCAINVGAGWASRRWIPRRYGQAARFMGQSFQVPSVVAWAGAKERQMAETVVKHSGGQAVLAPKTSLTELVSLMRRAQFYLGGDTGPMHLAAAVGTPCIGLFGPTLPKNSGPYGMGHVTAQAFYQEFDRRRCDAGMRAIELDHVKEAIVVMLKNLGFNATHSATDVQAA